MAVTLRRIRDQVRIRLRETDSQRPSFVVPEIDQALASAYLTLQARLPGTDLYTANAFTISAGADTFTLPSTVAQWTGAAEYMGGVHIELISTHWFLIPRSLGELNSYRIFSPTITLELPRLFALWEGGDQVINGRCYPGALVNELCNLYSTMAADDLRDFVGSGFSDLDDVSVSMSRAAATVLELFAASDLLDRMTKVDLDARRINPKVTVAWRRDAEILLYREAARRHDIEGASAAGGTGYGDNFGYNYGGPR